MHRLLLYSALLLLTQCSKCKDDPKPKPPVEDTLPAETQTGANSFGCLLNGQVWLPAGQPATARFYQNTLTLNANKRVVENGVTTRQSVHMSFDNNGLPIQVGHYVLGESSQDYVRYSDLESICEYESDTTPIGFVDITKLDYSLRIVSGRFAFTLRRAGCPDVQATDGRFDLKF
ncbi:hypothetical protein EJV47_08455 [Hymenobacter gummosus]|uniref:Uncharacterized protein n=1 Tax=Hymenobacter gummosus TaxID=1776032 RepID=A0A431U440_9BACT|nr:DUF6252 family protein [Hymenobacter gummosus]RTQ50655.1 hypothetical protein EJV47_08455 [Hymenobacter gummosus]